VIAGVFDAHVDYFSLRTSTRSRRAPPSSSPGIARARERASDDAPLCAIRVARRDREDKKEIFFIIIIHVLVLARRWSRGRHTTSTTTTRVVVVPRRWLSLAQVWAKIHQGGGAPAVVLSLHHD